MNIVLGQKKEQTQRFLENGTRIPVTVISIAPNNVLAIKTAEKDGYTAVQIGTGTRKKATRSQLGVARKANLTAAPKIIKEVRFFDANEAMPEVGSAISLIDILVPGDIINVTGQSKGKGWAGVVKRHNFRGGPRTHGQSDRERAPGSLGQTTTPGRVYKGKRMAGHMGVETVTIENLFVADIIDQNVYVAGLVPGHLNSFVTITKVGKMKDRNFSAMLRADGLDASEEMPTEPEVTETPAETKEEVAPQPAPEEPTETPATTEKPQTEEKPEEEPKESKEEEPKIEEPEEPTKQEEIKEPVKEEK